MSRRFGAVPTILLALGFAVAVPPACADEFDGARTAMRRHLAEHDIPGMSIAIWRDGRIVLEEGFGWADVARREPATAHTMFDVASVTKTMTAVGLMTLVQAGRVRLDAPANEYLGEPALWSRGVDAGTITVRHLANHISGLQGGDQFFFGAGIGDVPPVSQIIERYGFAFAEPGVRYRYSNLGYGVLGQVIAKVSGRGYGEFMREEVFVPLGMTRTSVDLADQSSPHVATRYDWDRQPIASIRSALPAAGAVYSSAHDLARFGLFLLKQPLTDQSAVLSDASIDAMLLNRVSMGKPDHEYGIGLTKEPLGGHVVIGHTGSSSGASAFFAMVPEHKLGVALLGNAHGAASEQLLSEILQGLLPDWRQAEPRSKAVPQKATFRPSAQLIGIWRGEVQTYERKLPMRLQVFPSGDVHLRIGEPRFAWGSTQQQDALLNNVTFADAELTGTTLAQIETSDTKRYPHTVSLSLKLRGEVLSGPATAVSRFDGLWIYGLPYWTELRKVGADADSGR